MEINDIEKSEVFLFLKEKAGEEFSFQELYRACTGYPDAFVLSRELGDLTRAKLIHKRGKSYTYEDPVKEIKKLLVEKGLAEPIKPEPPKPEPQVHRVVREPMAVPTSQPSTAPANQKVPPMGSLRRGAAAVPIALTFFFHQDTTFTVNDVAKRTGIGTQVAYQTLRRLNDEGYILQTGTIRKGAAQFIWSKKFRYPFPQIRPEDDGWRDVRIEKFNVPVEVVAVSPVLAPVPAPVVEPPVAPVQQNEPVSEESMDDVLATLDAMIRRYECELSALRASRDAYVASKC